MRKPDSRPAKTGLMLAVFTALLVWGACSDNGVSAPDGSACASDSLCKGGVRTLAAGQWWEEIQFDTLESVRDSGRVKVTRNVANEHHRRSEVLSATLQNGDWYYRIQTRDTLLRPGNPLGDSISVQNILLRHSDTVIEYSVPTGSAFLDTLKYAALKLPPEATPGTWTVIAKSVDSVMRIGNPPGLSFPVEYHLGIQADGDYGTLGSCLFGGKSYACRSVNRTSDFTLSIRSDTVLVFVDTLVSVDDTIAVSTTHSDQTDQFNFDLSATFLSREVETKLDTNYFDSTSTRENNIKVRMLTRYSDPRRILSN